MDKTPLSGGGPPCRKSIENGGVEPQESSNTISIEGNVSSSTIISGNENIVTINVLNEQERKIAGELLKINELLGKGQVSQAREKLEKIEALQVDFPGLELAAKRLQAVIIRQGYIRLMYAMFAAVILFLFSAYLVAKNKQALCETGEGYYLDGVLAVAEQEAESGGIKLWVGVSNEGLTIKNENRETEKAYGKEELNSNSITAIVHDDARNGTWVGTGGGGLVFIDSALNVRRQFTLKDGIPGCKITDVVLNQDGIYVTAIAGMGISFSTDGDNWATIPIPQDYRQKKQFDIFDAASDSDGSIWIGTYQDVYQLVGGNWKHYQPPNQDRPVTVQAIAVDDDSIKWVGTTNGLFLLDTRTGTDWSELFAAQDGLPSDRITDIAILDKNTVLVGTTNGVGSCRKNGGGLEIKCTIDKRFKGLGKINTITISLDGTRVYLGGEENNPIIR